MILRTLGLLLLGLALLPWMAHAQSGTINAIPTEATSNAILNAAVTGTAANLVVTATGATAARVHLYAVVATCSAIGVNVTPTLSVVDNATIVGVAQMPGGGSGGNTNPAPLALSFATGYTSAAAGTNMLVSFTSCGAGNIGALSIEADRF